MIFCSSWTAFCGTQKWKSVHLPTLRRNDACSGPFDWWRNGTSKNGMDRGMPQGGSLRFESRATAPPMKQRFLPWLFLPIKNSRLLVVEKTTIFNNDDSGVVTVSDWERLFVQPFFLCFILSCVVLAFSSKAERQEILNLLLCFFNTSQLNPNTHLVVRDKPLFDRRLFLPSFFFHLLSLERMKDARLLGHLLIP